MVFIREVLAETAVRGGSALAVAGLCTMVLFGGSALRHRFEIDNTGQNIGTIEAIERAQGIDLRDVTRTLEQQVTYLEEDIRNEVGRTIGGIGLFGAGMIN